MKKFFKVVLVLVIAVFMYGCNKSLEIQGSKSININESHTYIVVSVSTEDLALDSYKWEVDSKNKDFTLTNDESPEVVFNAKSVGKYTLEVRAKDGRKTFKAKMVIEVSEPEIINGHILPSEPDKTINDSTLLGVDVNDNGVRDDVERYVIKRYAKDPEFPKTKTALAMQYAWSTQKILENPTIDSKKYSDDAIDCQYYWFHQKQKDINQRIIDLAETDFNASIQVNLKAGEWRTKHKVFNDTDIKDKIYNTRERIEQKFSYNSALSGNIFNGREESLDNCQVNIDELGE